MYECARCGAVFASLAGFDGHQTRAGAACADPATMTRADGSPVFTRDRLGRWRRAARPGAGGWWHSRRGDRR